MKPCKDKLPDGKPCPNQVDDGQQYCPFHLANQITMPKKILSIALGVVATGILAVVAKVVAGSSSDKEQ